MNKQYEVTVIGYNITDRPVTASDPYNAMEEIVKDLPKDVSVLACVLHVASGLVFKVDCARVP